MAKEKKNKVGRPKKNIDFHQLKKLCEMHCTQEEACSFFEMDDKTLSARIKEAEYDNFSEFFKKHSGMGKISLRRLQFKSANNGSVPMQIWLGKNILGQKDNIINNNLSDISNSAKIILDTTGK